MNKEKLYDKFKKEFDVNDKVKGRRGKMKFADIIANKTFDKTYDSYVRNRQMSKSELQDLVLAEIRTEFTGIWGAIQFLLWLHRILVFIQFVLRELDD
jgi:hypothetical protein